MGAGEMSFQAVLIHCQAMVNMVFLCFLLVLVDNSDSSHFLHEWHSHCYMLHQEPVNEVWSLCLCLDQKLCVYFLCLVKPAFFVYVEHLVLCTTLLSHSTVRSCVIHPFSLHLLAVAEAVMTSLSLSRPWFDSRPFRMRFVVDTVALACVFTCPYYYTNVL